MPRHRAAPVSARLLHGRADLWPVPGQRPRLTGEGEAGAMGGPAGDLYVVIHVQEHPFFQRDGNDLACEIPVNFTTLALGGEIKVPSLLGDSETLKVPDGTATGSVFRM